MTDDGPQRPMKLPAKVAHHGPATRAWCGPLQLVVLPGGVVTLFVFSACRLVSRSLGCASGKNTTRREHQDSSGI